MITTGSKYFYGLSALLIVTAVVYGYSTGGGHVGPLSLGYKGGVGDVLGYTILMGAGAAAGFLGFAITAFRDADPEALADVVGTETAPAAAAPATSYWPIVGAFGAVLAVVGLVLNNVFFVAGLIALGAVAVEWTMQAWSERATGDPAVNREIRNRIMFPLEVPIAGAMAIAIVVLGYSRVFLAVSKENAVWGALIVAAIIFGVGTLLSTRDKIRSDLVAGLLAVAAVVTIGAGIFGALAGERDFEHHGEEHHGEEHGEEKGEHSEEEGDHSDEGESHSEDEDEGAAGAQETN